MDKDVYIKVYASDGTFKGLITQFAFNSITVSINSGVGELTLNIPKPFDNFGEGGLITHNNHVEVWIYDKEALSGRKIYSGYIAEYSPSIAEQETVEVRVLGYAAKLSLDIERSGTTIDFTYSATDPSAMIKDVIDKYKVINPSSRLDYGSGTTTIQNTGKSKGISLNSETFFGAIDAISKLGDYNWYWYVDVDNLVYFKPISTSADHMFVFGNDIQSLKLTKSIVQMRNGLLFWNGRLAGDPEYVSKLYSDSTSISTYGAQIEKKRDDRYLASTGGADEFGNRYVSTFKDPINTVEIRVVDNTLYSGYDIESIKAGQTCKVLNLESNNALTNNMLITQVTYYLNYVDLVLSDVTQYLARSLNNLRNTVDDITYPQEGPTTYS